VTRADKVVVPIGTLIFRLVLGLLLLLAGIALLGIVFRSELEALGRSFVERFGAKGMVLGTLIADGFHCPIPPQFYMLMGITSGYSAVKTLAAVNLGSFLGGWIGYFVSGKLSGIDFVARRLERPRRLVDAAFVRYGNWTVVVASFLPIAYSILCYLAGMNRIPKRAFALVTLLRIPRLFAYYYLVRLGWLGV
jgi:membrane protein DedA with SNARE-associated domain